MSRITRPIFTRTTPIFSVLREQISSGQGMCNSYFGQLQYLFIKYIFFSLDLSVCLALDKLFHKFENRQRVIEALRIPDEIKDYECPFLTIENGGYYCTNLAKAGSVCVAMCAPGYERVRGTKAGVRIDFRMYISCKCTMRTN